VRRLHLCLPLLLLAGCFTAAVDPTLSGVFACDDDDDCPLGQICTNDLCIAQDELPRVEIVDPPEAFPIPLAGYPGSFQITVSTNLELVDSGDEATVQTGFLRGSLVGTSVETEVHEGTGDVTLLFAYDPPGRGVPLKVFVQALSADGTPFPNEEASDTVLLWIDNGDPLVAFRRPWPGDAFPAGQQSGVDIAVATLNFDIAPPGFMGDNPSGHVHVFQDNPPTMIPPDCLAQQNARLDCSAESNVYAPQIPAPTDPPTNLLERTISLNEVAAGPSGLAVVLVRDDHVSLDNGMGGVVVDEIDLDRMP
jgi:hypothetical protein